MIEPEELKSGARVYYVALVELTATTRISSDLMIQSREAGSYPAGTKLYFTKRQPGRKGLWRLTVRGHLALPIATEKQAKETIAASDIGEVVRGNFPGRLRVAEVREERVVGVVYPLSPLQVLARTAE